MKRDNVKFLGDLLVIASQHDVVVNRNNHTFMFKPKKFKPVLFMQEGIFANFVIPKRVV